MKKIYIAIISFMVLNSFILNAQVDTTQKESPFSFNTDIATSYLWRGQEYSKSPNLQPYITFEKGGLTAGTWGSFSVNGDYQEVDFYISYTLGNFTAGIYDYYTIVDGVDMDFFDVTNATTDHCLEGQLVFEAGEETPLKLTASSFFFGNDRDSVGDCNYTLYFEAQYSIGNIDLFAGGTPTKGFYGDKTGLINVGMKFNKEIKITDNFSIPASMSLVSNPAKKGIYLMALFTL